MKNRSAKAVILACALLAIGLVIGIAGSIANHFDFSDLDANTYETNTHGITEPFKSISVDTDISDVQFVLTEADDCTVICSEREDLRHRVYVKEETLVIEVEDERHWYDHIGFFFGKQHVTVHLPKASYESLTVETDTGDVEVAAGLQFNSVKTDTDTGDVRVYANVFDELSVQTDTGDVTANSISPMTVRLSTDTGDILLADTRCSTVDIETDTGKITLRNTIAIKTITVKSATGDVHLLASDASSLYVKTSTGDVSGHLLTDKIFITATSTGKVRVPSTTTGGKCEIITSTGDITFEAAPIAEEIFQTAPIPDDIPE